MSAHADALADHGDPPAGMAAAALNRADVTHQPTVHDPVIDDVPVEVPHNDEKPANIIMAAAQGAQTGVGLAVAVGAMVLAFVALIALANGMVGWHRPDWFGFSGDITFQLHDRLRCSRRSCLPAGDVPDWTEAGCRPAACSATKIVLNEFVAYHRTGQGAGGAVSPRTVGDHHLCTCAGSPTSRRSRSRWR